MILSIYNFKLYYPEHGDSAGADREEVSREEIDTRLEKSRTKVTKTTLDKYKALIRARVKSKDSDLDFNVDRPREMSGGTPVVTQEEINYADQYNVSVEEAKEILKDINRDGAAPWTGVYTNTYDFDTPQGIGPISNTDIDIEKRAEARKRKKLKRKKRIRDYGDEYSGDGDVRGEEKRNTPNRKTYGQPDEPPVIKTKYNKVRSDNPKESS